MKHFGIMAAAGILLLVAGACKPTEKNYALAYDKAYQASQRKAEEEKTGYDGRTLENMNNSIRRDVVEGDTIYVSTELVNPTDKYSGVTTKRIGIVVSKYKMQTNANSTVADLAERYPGAYVATDGKGYFYVIASGAETRPEAVKQIRSFVANNPDFRYMGLNGEPVAVYLSGR
ncbi:MAG: hypothetical protein J1E97_01810 [Muribaculaceae bacterium]|nr:hypothetical protein [Muribaculaceae bacterium]